MNCPDPDLQLPPGVHLADGAVRFANSERLCDISLKMDLLYLFSFFLFLCAISFVKRAIADNLLAMHAI